MCMFCCAVRRQGSGPSVRVNLDVAVQRSLRRGWLLIVAVFGFVGWRWMRRTAKEACPPRFDGASSAAGRGVPARRRRGQRAFEAVSGGGPVRPLPPRFNRAKGSEGARGLVALR